MRKAAVRRTCGAMGRLVRLASCAGLALAVLAPPLRPQWKNPPEKVVLNNGLSVITQKDDSSGITTLEILARGGRRAEPAGQEGVSYLTTRLALEIPDRSSVQELMEKSCRTMMTSKGDCAVIHLECLSEYLDDTLKIYIDILKDPLFTGIRIGRITDFMNNQRKIESDDNLNVGHLAQRAVFLKGLGYAGSTFGEEKALKALRGRDIEAFYTSHFVPANMILVAISDLDAAVLGQILKKHFGSLKPIAAPKTAALAALGQVSPDVPKETIIDKTTNQALVSIGFPLPRLTARNYALAILAESLLGKGPGSRLWPLRTEKKLAYNVNAKATLMTEGGLFEAYLEADPAKTAESRAALDVIFREIRETGIAAEELQEAKMSAKTDFLRSNEPKSKRTETLGAFEALGLGFDYFLRFSEELNGVTLEEVNAYLRDIFSPDRSHVVIVGRKM